MLVSKFIGRIFSVFVVTLAICSCASGVRPNNMAVEAIEGAHFGNYTNNMMVGDISGGQSTNPLWMSRVSDIDFDTALGQSLQNNGLLNLENPKYRVNADLVSVKQPITNTDLNVVTKVNYTITDMEQNIVVFAKTVESNYKVGTKEEALYEERLKGSTEGAIKLNIEDFIKSLHR